MYNLTPNNGLELHIPVITSVIRGVRTCSWYVVINERTH